MAAFLKKARMISIVEHEMINAQFSELVNHIRIANIENKEIIISKATGKAKFSREVLEALSGGRATQVYKLARLASSYQHYTTRGLGSLLRDLVI